MRFGIALKAVCDSCGQPIPDQDYVIQVGELVICPTRATVAISGKPIHLTPTERRILTLLAANPGDLCTWADLYETGCGMQVSEHYKRDQKHALRVHVSRLKGRLGSEVAGYIQTVRGPIEEGGLRMVPPV